MLFNSLSFAIFFPIVFLLYWAVPHRYRWTLLLVSSYYFYMSWNVKYVFLILFTTVISYICARLLEKTKERLRRRLILGVAAFLCLTVLFLFKYLSFFMENVFYIANALVIPLEPITLKLTLPVGISFYTFQTLSYVIDVYRGEVKAERHFGKYAVFISFFPQLVAGPIERSSSLLSQINQEHCFDYKRVTYGLKLMAWGYYKKLVLADMLAVYVDKIYGNVTAYKGLSLIVASVAFAFQIYCDFSGYSDIAIGAAKMFDINLMNNFKSPYFSSSLKEFWSRWHISLSTWFRDYLYIPLGGSQCSRLKHYRNFMITFLCSGLWHGANWTYVIWGGIHGAGQISESIANKGKKKIEEEHLFKRLMRIGITYVFCNVAWVFFRAASVEDALYVFQYAFSGILHPFTYIMNSAAELSLNRYKVIYIMIPVMILIIYDWLSLKIDVIEKISEKKLFIRWSYYIIFLLIIVFFARKGVAADFVYFQF